MILARVSFVPCRSELVDGTDLVFDSRSVVLWQILFQVPETKKRVNKNMTKVEIEKREKEEKIENKNKREKMNLKNNI